MALRTHNPAHYNPPMLDIVLLRKDLDAAVARLQTRKNPQSFLNVDAFRALEGERKTLQTRTEELQSQRNSLSKQIGMLKGKGQHAEAEAVMAQVGAIKDELDASAQRLEVIQTELQNLLLAVPNLPHESVPVGAGEEGNIEVRRWGVVLTSSSRTMWTSAARWVWTLRPAPS